VAGVPIDIDDLQQQLVRCDACEYVFVDPSVPEERLLDCYRRSDGHHWPTDDSVAHWRCYDRKRDVLVRHLGAGRRVLDFGCYDGGFLTYLGDGFERWGIEPSEAAAERARQAGVKILGPTIEEADPAASSTFDGIISIDVMEHLSDPVPVLAGLRGLLKPGGVLVVETGNYDAPAFRKLGPLYYYVAIVEHVGFFNRRSIAEAGRRAGLELVDFQKSAHSRRPSSRAMAVVINSLYWTLRAARRMRLPLPAKLANIAAGPVPRHSDQDDHFLAVLRRPAEPSPNES
jgi:SAM-dependent methyltransferase